MADNSTTLKATWKLLTTRMEQAKRTPETAIEEAISTATIAHFGQRDKQGEPYILHVMRVVNRVRDRGFGRMPEYMVAAALHDVVEDTPLTVAHLQQLGFSFDATVAVEFLTRRPGELYTEFVKRASQNKIAHVVKIADIEDHLERTTAMGFKKYETYKQALRFLTGELR